MLIVRNFLQFSFLHDGTQREATVCESITVKFRQLPATIFNYQLRPPKKKKPKKKEKQPTAYGIHISQHGSDRVNIRTPLVDSTCTVYQFASFREIAQSTYEAQIRSKFGSSQFASLRPEAKMRGTSFLLPFVAGFRLEKRLFHLQTR